MSGTKWLTPTSGYLSGYSHTLNPYSGCSYGCSYCYVRKLPVALFRGEEWGTWADAKKAAPEQLTRELAKAKSKGPVAIFFSSATDPYQPLEARLGLTRSLLAAMADEPPDFVLVQTRSPLVERDIDMLLRLRGRVRVSVTVETDRDDVRRIVTPGAPPYAARLNALRRLREAGVDTQAAVSPLLPYTPAFPALLAEAAPRVVADDFARGDGSGGRRSRQLGMAELFAREGWGDSHDTAVLERFVAELRTLLPPERIGVGAAGFAPPAAAMRD